MIEEFQMGSVRYIYPEILGTFLKSRQNVNTIAVWSAVSNESIHFAVFRILQEEGKTTGA